MTPSTDIIHSFCPTGTLRASINLGNPLLASTDESGRPVGVSVDIAQHLAQILGVEITLLAVEKALKSVEAVATEQADIGFFAIDPARGAQIAFSHPYVVIEGYYLVRDGAAINTNAAVDQAGNRVVVGTGSAYDLFLSRELKNATIVRATSSQTVVSTFLDSGAEVAAGVKQQLQADAQLHDGLHLLDERFMLIQQALGLPKSRGAAAAAFLQDFVTQLKQSGFIFAALQKHGISGAAVAPDS